jgi:hypothetical protein
VAREEEAGVSSIDFKLPSVDGRNETLKVWRRHHGDALHWTLYIRSWYGGHRPDYDFVRVLTEEQAIELVMTGRADDFYDSVKEHLERNAVDQLADVARKDENPG